MALFVCVIERYLNMGASQYLRDVRRDYNIKKSAELQKRVLQRQHKAKERTGSVPFKVKENLKNITIVVTLLH